MIIKDIRLDGYSILVELEETDAVIVIPIQDITTKQQVIDFIKIEIAALEKTGTQEKFNALDLASLKGEEIA